MNLVWFGRGFVGLVCCLLGTLLDSLAYFMWTKKLIICVVLVNTLSKRVIHEQSLAAILALTGRVYWLLLLLFKVF